MAKAWSLLLLGLMAVAVLPAAAAARPSFAKPVYLDSLFRQEAPVNRPAAAVPEPQTSRVQVFIFKKGTIWWAGKPGDPAGPQLRASAVRLPLAAGDPRLGKIIAKYAQQQGLDPRLVHTVIRHESGFDPGAVSPKGAMGLMQLMPETAASLGVEDPFDVEQNIKGGTRFLKICLNRFDYNLPLALAAYNAGPGRVVEHQGVPPIKETQEYVKKVVQDYSGQTLDPAQIRLQPAAAPPPEASVAGPPLAPEIAAPACPPALNLPLFTLPAPDLPRGMIIP